MAELHDYVGNGALGRHGTCSLRQQSGPKQDACSISPLLYIFTSFLLSILLSFLPHYYVLEIPLSHHYYLIITHYYRNNGSIITYCYFYYHLLLLLLLNHYYLYDGFIITYYRNNGFIITYYYYVYYDNR